MKRVARSGREGDAGRWGWSGIVVRWYIDRDALPCGGARGGESDSAADVWVSRGWAVADMAACRAPCMPLAWHSYYGKYIVS